MMTSSEFIHPDIDLPFLKQIMHTIIRFNKKLETFGWDIQDLQKPAYHRTFRAWIEDWERPLLVTNDSVAEAKLLAKYKGLRFFLPDDEVVYTIFESNLEFQKGSKRKKISKGWNVFGVPPDSDNGDDDKPFMIDDLLCQLIADTEQEKGVEVIKYDKMPANDDGNDDEDDD